MALVEIRDVHKVFQRDSERIEIFTGLSLDIDEGTFTALMGPSGSGKSTLLNLLAGLDKPTSGTVRVAGSEVSAMTPGQLAAWRAQHIGFVFQTSTCCPCSPPTRTWSCRCCSPRSRRRSATSGCGIALGVVGAGATGWITIPRQLSGGQEQRVAIARAIVADPTLVLLDEPTGQLDAKSSQEVLGLLQRLNAEFKKTIIDGDTRRQAAERAKTVLHLEKGDPGGAPGGGDGMKFLPPRAGQSRPAQAAHVPHHRQRGAGALPVRLAADGGHDAWSEPRSSAARGGWS